MIMWRSIFFTSSETEELRERSSTESNRDLKIEVEDETTVIKALEDSVCKNFGQPLDTMTIRSYCKYYRIAHEAYDRYLKGLILHERYVPFEWSTIGITRCRILQHGYIL